MLSVLSLEELGARGNKGLAGIVNNPVHSAAIAGLATSATAQATIEVRASPLIQGDDVGMDEPQAQHTRRRHASQAEAWVVDRAGMPSAARVDALPPCRRRTHDVLWRC